MGLLLCVRDNAGAESVGLNHRGCISGLVLRNGDFNPFLHNPFLLKDFEDIDFFINFAE